MDTAQVRHQYIVDEHPHIVITGEVVGDRVPSGRHAALLLDKAGGHAQTEVVVQVSIVGRHFFLG